MTQYWHDIVTTGRRTVTRRRFLHQIGALSAGALTLRDALSLQAEELRRQGKSMILLWMAGGPSQMETFDPKPDHENGAGVQAISTSVLGIQIASGWEETAKVMQDIALIRSMTNKEGNHQRATYQLHTGYIPSGSVKHPAYGSLVAQQLADPHSDLPSVVSIGRSAQGAGFLGVNYEPFVVERAGELPPNLSNPVPADRLQRRIGLLKKLDGEFARSGGEYAVNNHSQLYQKTSRLVFSPESRRFTINDESAPLRERYGDSEFGRGCLLARRLVESGATFVEVQSGGWDMHDDLRNRMSKTSQTVDPAAATLIADLKDRGLLDRTLVVWAGEFGRTPKINARAGRDHFPRAFNCWLAGCGIRGGQVIGKTTADGTAVDDRPVSVADLLQTISQALGVNPGLENISPLGRPLKVVDGGEPVRELFS